MKTIVVCVLLLVLCTVWMVNGKNCIKGLNYCGWDLRKIGIYYNQIVEAIGSGDNINDKLFHCLGGPNGEIKHIENCQRCADGGDGSSDFCVRRKYLKGNGIKLNLINSNGIEKCLQRNSTSVMCVHLIQ